MTSVGNRIRADCPAAGEVQPVHATGVRGAERAEALRARILELDLGLDRLEDPQQISVDRDVGRQVLPTSVSVAEPTEPTRSSPVKSWLSRIYRVRSSWATSAMIHTLLIVCLAVLTLGVRDKREEPPIAVSLDGETMLDPEQPLEINPVVMTSGKSSIGETLETPPIPIDTVTLPVPNLALGQFEVRTNFDHAGSALLKVQTEEPQPAWQGAQFFGVQATGNRFVFVVDSSTSMVDKVEDAQGELEAALRRLKKDQQFFVIFFDRDAELMRFGHWDETRTRFLFNPEPEKALAYATPENVDACTYWMRAVRLESATNPYEAMAFALGVLHPDAIYLLSDGELTDRGLTESYLWRTNVEVDSDGQRHPKTVVHCIGFYSRDGEVVLKRIAAANGGSYRFVDPPFGYIPRVRTPGYGGVPRRR